MVRKMLKKSKRLIAASGIAAMAASGANAALDTAVTTQFATTTADVTEAGVLIISLAAVALGIRWVKATFF